MRALALEVYRNPKVLNYLRSEHLKLRNNYKMPDGESPWACSDIAIEVARKVLEVGDKPLLVRIRGGLVPGSTINTETLIPRIYEGRVAWGGHMIVCVEDTALDPMIGVPMMLDDYKSTVFQRPATSKVFITPQGIEQFVNENNS